MLRVAPLAAAGRARAASRPAASRPFGPAVGMRWPCAARVRVQPQRPLHWVQAARQALDEDAAQRGRRRLLPPQVAKGGSGGAEGLQVRGLQPAQLRGQHAGGVQQVEAVLGPGAAGMPVRVLERERRVGLGQYRKECTTSLLACTVIWT